MSCTQRWWISFCIMGIMVTNSVCWARFERSGLGQYTLAALSWVFRRSKIPWEELLCKSTRVVLKRYGIREGTLLIDDTDKKRSKFTTRISKVHKIKDKVSGGYIMGQCMVFLVLVTAKVTLPVGFMFYLPDPAMSAWRKRDVEFRKRGVPARQRPCKPPKDDRYPTKEELGLMLLRRFKEDHQKVRVRCVLADAVYGTKGFLDTASDIFGGIQVISQVRMNQKVRFRGKEVSVKHYFEKHSGVPHAITIRGGEEVRAVIGSARLHIRSHGKKRFVVALKYEGEEEERYLLASDMSWKTLDIVEAHTLRWLAEVFYEDWKSYEGWGKLTKQQGEEGSSRSL
ncbi:MAG: transposase, partial [Deltaproteobacteria bacterium]